MKLARVVGSVVATRKEGNVDRLKILLVSYLDETLKETHKTAAAIDTVNAGEGDLVLLCASSSARLTSMTRDAATDNTIIGIVDCVALGEATIYQKGTAGGDGA